MLFERLFSRRPVSVEVQPESIYEVKLCYAGTILKFNAAASRVTVGDNTRNFFQINRSAVLINDEAASDYIATDLAAQCGSVIYPLQVEVVDREMIRVFNYEEIRKRWAEKEPLIRQYFTGVDAYEYINATKATLENETQFLQALRQDPFLTRWFDVTIQDGVLTANKIS
jgi:hypothetical protein